ncbi:LapA family protein [Nocardia jejuensis]|uniref:LapA family protein n=1 Tax=Nocardia jejuensis TaxID=328049 RepID=UPI000836A1A6|nr:LapA family protein [Nocardia jejuensis]
MFIIIGLIALLGAVAVGVAGIQANSGDSHTLTDGFTVFDHTYSGSSGTLFAYGILVGAIGTCGLIMLLAGTWSSSRRGMAARRELRQSRREMAAARKELDTTTVAARPVEKPVVAPAPKPVKAPTAPPVAAATDSKPTWSFNRFMNRQSPPKAQTLSK